MIFVFLTTIFVKYVQKYDCPPMYDILKQTPQRLQVIIVYFRYTFLHN